MWRQSTYTAWAVSIGLPFLLVAVVSFFSFYHLTESPPVWYDEGLYSQVAQNIATYNIDGLQIAPSVFVSAWSVNGGFSFIGPIALTYKLFGVGVLQGRALMALVTILFAVISYALIRKLYGPTHALFALLLCATFPVLYGTGKNILGEVPGLVYLIVFLFLLNKIEQEDFRSRWWIFFITGILAGLCIIAKPLFLVLLGALGFMGLLRLRNIPWSLSWMLPAAAGLCIPVFIHISTHMIDAGGQSLASYYANPYAENSLTTIIIQNALRFLKELSPMYCALIFGVWALSIALRVYRKVTVPLAESVAFTFSLFVLGFYLRTAGWYRYFFTANILSLLFFPQAISHLFSVIRVRNTHVQTVIKTLPVAIILILTVVQIYQLLFTSWVAVHNNSTVTATLEKDFVDFGSKPVLFFLNTPEITIFAKGNPYYQYIASAPEPMGTQELPLLTQGVPDIVIVKQDAVEMYATYLTQYESSSMPGDYALYIRRP